MTRCWRVTRTAPRADAARRLARARPAGSRHTTNRDLLVAILREPVPAGGTDTGYLTRHDPAPRSRAATLRRHALAAALARQAGPRRAPVLGTVPSGWRSVFSARSASATAWRGSRAYGRGDPSTRSRRPLSVRPRGTPDVVDLESTAPGSTGPAASARTYVDASDDSSAVGPRSSAVRPSCARSLLAPCPAGCGCWPTAQWSPRASRSGAGGDEVDRPSARPPTACWPNSGPRRGTVSTDQVPRYSKLQDSDVPAT
jgi:hypothetical protein